MWRLCPKGGIVQNFYFLLFLNEHYNNIHNLKKMIFFLKSPFRWISNLQISTFLFQIRKIYTRGYCGDYRKICREKSKLKRVGVGSERTQIIYNRLPMTWQGGLRKYERCPSENFTSVSPEISGERHGQVTLWAADGTLYGEYTFGICTERKMLFR